jgi:hypothetical protein
MSTIDELKATIGGRGGIHSPNRFQITFNPPGGGLGGRDLTLLCEAVNIPGRQITTFEYPYNAVEQQVKVPNGFINEDITCTFLVTNDFSIPTMFEAWRKAIINDDYLLEYANVYERTITIIALDQQNTQVHRVWLDKAYPITVNSIALSNATTNETTKLEVTFTYVNMRFQA